MFVGTPVGVFFLSFATGGLVAALVSVGVLVGREVTVKVLVKVITRLGVGVITSSWNLQKK